MYFTPTKSNFYSKKTSLDFQINDVQEVIELSNYVKLIKTKLKIIFQLKSNY